MAIEDQISTLITDVSGNRTASDMLAQLNNRIAAVDESKGVVGDAKRASR